ncbi:MAG: aminotransferase class V-fold PLP-dependent enzyme [Ruminiclostridium sp.]|nr:aminotransferase class V-fold PLP-dependent enzyme [Ruminiclostridium sp.]
MKQFIYADNAATTKLDIDAFEAMKPFLLDEYGNASQPYSFARKPKQALKEARAIIAQCINAEPEEIYFTSGGTESDNWAIKGVAFTDPEKHAIITSQIEHHAVLRACEDIEKLGHPVVYLPVTKEGIVTTESLNSMITTSTLLVSVMYANNEIGTIEPIKELCEIAHRNGALFHTDSVQAVGHVHIDVKALGVDMLSASAHKFNGPKGIGFLYIKKGTPITSYASGGAQEFDMRAGTENVASIVGMAVALKKNCEAINENAKHLNMLEATLIDRLSAAGLDFVRNGSSKHIPGNISLSFKNRDGEVLLHRLDLMGICVSTGAACDTVNTKTSHVLNAIGLNQEYAQGTIRFSLGKNNVIDEINHIITALKSIFAKR